VVTALVIGVVVALVVAAGWWIAQPRLNADVREPDEPLPLFSSRVDDGSAGARQHPGIEPAEVAMLRRGPTPSVPQAPVPQAPVPSTPVADVDTSAPTPTARQDAVRPETPPPRHRESNGKSADGAFPPLPLAERASMVPVPAGTVQFLPGRLEVLQGRGVAGQELRFIRPENPAERPSVTFGRGEGPPYRHVQLRAPTVSRLHARIVLLDGGVWTLENLSTTNPIVLNGAELIAGSAPAPLADGDRIEMGEIVFRYRQR
jgi:pSer/pThr/pTyr-binding forkhead associated (FHA) protein